LGFPSAALDLARNVQRQLDKFTPQALPWCCIPATCQLSISIIATLKRDLWWFGGGDCPYLSFAEDAAHFHSTFKLACDPHHPGIIQCLNAGDEYFISNIARKCEA